MYTKLYLPTVLILLTPALSIPNPEVTMHQDAHIDIETYSLKNCKGSKTTHPGVTFDYQIPVTFRSYTISRDLDPSEQLDFSTGNLPAGTFGKRDDPGNDPPGCTKYYRSAKSGLKAGYGCYTLDQDVNCFRLWKRGQGLPDLGSKALAAIGAMQKGAAKALGDKALNGKRV